MNQLCYRLVFNRTRGQLMAVAETARSHAGSRMLFAGLPLIGVLLWALLPTAGHAQIVPDRSAAPERQPVTNNAPNGVPLVNIQTPNQAGVSRNAYSQFDVQQNGAILNNATQAVQTRLGGWVQANPLLNRSASVIVNEVNSSDPSLLRGYVEVAGQRAQLIIANPSGISCDGCGFINAYRATVTTGVPQYGVNGTLDSYLVRGGAVRFAGDGLDARSTDFTDVIARAVQVNAALRAQQLHVIAGSNDVRADTLQATPVAGSDSQPAFAIDVSALGGMYARKIWLVGTDAGVGMRHAGTIGGGASEIHVTAAGRLEVTGLIASAGSLDVQAAQGLDNHGTLHAATDASLQVAGVLDNRSGMIAAGGVLSVADAGPGERTLAITNTGGTLVASQRVSVDAARLSGDGKVLGVTDVDIQLTSDYDHTGELAANRQLRLSTTGTVNNHAAISAGQSLAVTADKLNNEVDGTFGSPTLTLTATAPHALINRGLIDGGDVLLKSTTIKNLGTGRVYGDHVMLDADIVLNDAEASASPVIAARTRLDIAAEQVTNREGALLYSEGELAIGRHLDAEGHATGQARLLQNTSATIEAQGDIDIAADEVINLNAHYGTRSETRPTETVVELAGSGSPNRYAPDAPGVYVYNDESDHLHTPEGNYENWLRYHYQRSETVDVTATSAPAQIIAGANLHVRSQALTNDKSRVLAGQDLDVQAATVKNIDATGTRTISDSGTVTSFWRDHEKGPDRTGVSSAAYEPPPVVQTVSLGVVAYRDHAKPAPAGIVDIGSGSGAIRTVSLSAAVPAGSLYHTAPEARGYLVETDPRFANYKQWLASDYLLQRLALDPQQMNKRLGDGFYEQKLVREQVAQLTGRRFLPGYANDEAQFQALMDSGATFAQAHQLRPGVALSAEQMAALTSDIVWLVEREVTLPAGQVTRALVPQLYVQVRDGDLKPDGTLLGGEQVRLTLTGDLNNGGTIAGRQVVALNAANVKNVGGTVAGGSVNAADQMGGIQASISVGSTKSDSHSVVRKNEAVASSVGAGGNVTIVAKGDTQQSDVTVQGSQLAAGKQLTVVADHAVNLQAAANTQTQQSSNRSSSASVGVTFSLGTNTGVGVNASGSLGRGHANGQDLNWTNTTLAGGEQVRLQSGAATTIKGAVVAAPKVTVASGGQLVIESLQDSSSYRSSQQQVGGSVTIGTAPSANLNYAKGKVDSTYASVAEQSGIRAGDGGFTVTVAGDTTLKGGAITSTQAAIDARRNAFNTGGTLTTTDIDNHTRYEAESVSVNVGTGFSAQGALAPMGTGVGFGHDSDRASSTTTSGISDVAGDKALRTGDKGTGIAKIFDADRVQQEVSAQTQITQMFSTLAPRQVASYAGSKLNEINAQLGQETDPQRRADLLGEKAKWEEGDVYRMLMHTAVGGLAGDVSGAAGAGAAALAAPKLNDMQANLEASLVKAGMNPTVAKGVAANASGLAAAGIGGAVGGATGAGMAMSVDQNNRQLHPDEKARIKQLAVGDAKKEARLTAAACAMVKCYAEYPIDSQAYQQLKQLAEIGAGDALSNERQLLAQQTGMFAYSTNGLLSDANKDAFKQVNNTYQLTTRALGAGQATLGGLGFAASVASAPVTCATGAGCVANAVVATTSLDALQAGTKQMVSGNSASTYLNQGFQGLGMSPEAALIAETVLSVGASAQAGKVFYQSVDRSIEISKLSSASYENFIANGVRVTPEVMQMPQAQALMKEVRGSFPNLTDQQIKGIVANYIESGSNLPQMEIAGQGSVLIKVVPKGTDISPTSGYWMTVQQARAIAALEPAQIGNILGLPAGQAANAMRDGVEFYAITPKLGVSPKIFFSEVANTNQGRVAMNGGAQQVIVPNRENWTNPTRVDPFNLHPMRGK